MYLGSRIALVSKSERYQLEHYKHYRHLVIFELERHSNVELQQVGRRPKWQKDKLGRNWWVLISESGWCGIPVEMVNDELKKPKET